LFAVQLAWIARVCWCRTGLPCAAAAMALASTASAIVAVLAWEGHRANSIPLSWLIPLAVVAGAAPLCLLIESRLHRPEWAAWRDYEEDKSLWDFLTGRHIPDLRGHH
jgi:hypothetical protein